MTQKTLGLNFRDILSKVSWKVLETTDSLDKTKLFLRTAKASLLVSDDSADYPVTTVLRHQLFDFIGLLTPTIAMCSEFNRNEKAALLKMGAGQVLSKPITPKGFLEIFENTIKKWSMAPLSHARTVANLFMNRKKQDAYKLLIKLSHSDNTHPIIFAALAYIYRNENHPKKAEQVLITGLKKTGLSLTVLLHLIDLYLYSGLPGIALEFLNKAHKAFGEPVFLNVDFIQAYLMLNQVHKSIPHLKKMLERDYMSAEMKQYLTRIYYSTGYLDEFDKAICFRSSRFDEYQKAWHIISDQDAKKRKNQYENLVDTKRGRERLQRKGQMPDEALNEEELKSKFSDARYLEFDGSPLFKRKIS